jgi:hypothetical protein
MTDVLNTASNEKPREFRCLVCGSQCTESPGGDLEYGHVDGCPHQPAEFCRCIGEQPGVDDEIDDDAVLIGADSKLWTLRPLLCPTCRQGGFESAQALKIHHSHEHGRRLAEIIQCETCECWFAPTSNSEKKYCSLECAGKSRRERVLVECEHCGEERSLSPSDAERFRFCSEACREAETWETLNCEFCETEVRRPASSHRSYCSPTCRHEDDCSRPRPDDPEMALWLFAVYEDFDCEDTAARMTLYYGGEWTAGAVHERLVANGWADAAGADPDAEISAPDDTDERLPPAEVMGS